MVHALLHLLVPGVVALLFYRPHWRRVWLILAAALLLDVDHLGATPMFEIIQAPATAADAYEQAAESKTIAAMGTRLATLALPELLRQLRNHLELMRRLITGMRPDPNPCWAELYRAFTDANKLRAGVDLKGAPNSPTPRAKHLRTPHLHRQNAQPVRLARTNYPADATITVENQSDSLFLLWMAQPDGAETTPQTFPADKVTSVTRAALGPDNAMYLTGRFTADAGDEAQIVVRAGA